MKKLLLMLVTMLTVMGCQAPPKTLIIAPTMHSASTFDYAGTAVNLSVVDRRSYQYVAKVSEDNDKHDIYSSSQLLTQTISRIVEQKWRDSGMTFNPQSKIKVVIYIDELITDVSTKSLSHDAETQIKLKVEASNNGRTFNSQYAASGSQEGALSPDNATIERQINKHLASALFQLIADQQLATFIKE